MGKLRKTGKNDNRIDDVATMVAKSQLKTIDTCSSMEDIRLHLADKRPGDSNNDLSEIFQVVKVLHGLRIA